MKHTEVLRFTAGLSVTGAALNYVQKHQNARML